MDQMFSFSIAIMLNYILQDGKYKYGIMLWHYVLSYDAENSVSWNTIHNVNIFKENLKIINAELFTKFLMDRIIHLKVKAHH